MTPEQLEKAIEFLLEHQARFSSDMDQLKQAQTRLETNQEQLQADLKALTTITESLVAGLIESRQQADADRRIMREVVQDLKDSIALGHTKADLANRRLDTLENG